VEACAAFCFVLIGVPLGIKTQRKDSTIGIAISLVVSMSFYLFIIMAETFEQTPAIYPHVLIWLPVIICLGFATYLIPKNL
jgi:lipopolysaccharide export system permease protein